MRGAIEDLGDEYYAASPRVGAQRCLSKISGSVSDTEHDDGSSLHSTARRG